jgi:hypothetical protein
MKRILNKEQGILNIEVRQAESASPIPPTRQRVCGGFAATVNGQQSTVFDWSASAEIREDNLNRRKD